MIVDDLLKLLETYPQDWEIQIRVNGVKALIEGLTIEGTEGEVCVIIHDYTEA